MAGAATKPARRIAVVLFNLGGPDSLDAVQPYLFNLFSDPAIISLPNPLRWAVAKLISSRRAPTTQDIYRQIGNRSPLVEQSEAQARHLEQQLANMGEVRAFLAMRYWHPFAEETAREVKAFAPDEVVLMPLYPQYSTTTTGSSIKDWHKAARKVGLTAQTHTLCCYPLQESFLEAHVELLAASYHQASEKGPVRLLLSAHGLPQKVVDGGDPYEWQVKATCEAVIERLKNRLGVEELDWIGCYQSRVGPLKWLEPNTEDEIIRAAQDGRAVVLAPIAFVSEHSETLVELDIEYRELFEAHGGGVYERVPALQTLPAFIEALAAGVRTALGNGRVCAYNGARLCPAGLKRCFQSEHAVR